MRVLCGFVPATSSQWYTSLFHLCTTRDSFPVRVLMGILHVILSQFQVLLKVTICPLQVCVCVLHVTWPPLHVLNMSVRVLPVILSSLHLPVTYIPIPWLCCTWLSQLLLFLQQFSAKWPRVSLNIKGVNFSPVTNVYKTIRPTGWLYLLLKEAYHKLPRKPKDEN